MLARVSVRPNVLSCDVKFPYAINVQYLKKTKITKGGLLVKSLPFASHVQKRPNSTLPSQRTTVMFSPKKRQSLKSKFLF